MPNGEQSTVKQEHSLAVTAVGALAHADLASFGLVDGPADADLEKIVRLAAKAARTGRAFVTIIQNDRIHTIAAHGSDFHNIPATNSMCAAACRNSAPLIVNDLAADENFSALPQVASVDGNRFYAGFPLHIEEETTFGTLCVIDSHAKPEGLPASVIGELQDLAQLTMRILRSRQQDIRWQEFMTIAADWIWEQDDQYRFVYFSDTLSDNDIDRKLFMGKTRWEALSNSPEEEIFWRDHRETLDQRLPFEDFRYRWINKGGVRYTSISGRPIFTADETFLGYRGSARDVTAEEVARQRVEHLARHDPLTGLANRTTFETRLGEQFLAWQETGASAVVLLLDIDHFKRINDTIGHSGGDAFLLEVAERLRRHTSAQAVIARLGGDEFAILEPSLNRDGALHEFATAISEVLSAPYDFSERIDGGCSIGIAVLPDHGGNPSQIIGNADLALYHAKATGRGRYSVFEPVMRREADKRHDLLRELSIAQPTGQFALAYQPIVKLQDHAVVGIEALMRWNHPVRGQLEPKEFLHALDASKYAADAGYWVLEKACEAAVSWLAQSNGDFRLAVRLFSAQLRDPGLVNHIKFILEKTGFDGRHLELEITEGILLHQTPELTEALGALKRLGVSLALGDFGTGYSSLSHLLHYPIDRIKLGRQFATGLAQNTDRGRVANALIKLAVELGLKVTAEHIDSTEERIFLSSVGCDDIQGFHFAQPVNAEMVGALLRSKANKATVPLTLEFG